MRRSKSSNDGVGSCGPRRTNVPSGIPEARGSPPTAPTPWTPGIAASRSWSRSIIAMRFVLSASVPGKSGKTSIATMLSVRKPGSTSSARRKLRAKSARPASRSAVTAAWTARRAPCARKLPAAWPERPAARSRYRPSGDRLEATAATARAATRHSAVAKTKTGASREISATRGRLSPERALMAPRLQPHRTSPAAAPANETSRDSAKIARKRSPREAPSAARTASSRRRDAIRARERLVTFAAATSMRNPTAESSIKSAGRTRPTSVSLRGLTAAPTRSASSPCSRRMRAAIEPRSARAAASEIPSRRRPTPFQLCAERLSSGSSRSRAVQSCVSSGNWKPGGMTPTTRYRSPSKRSERRERSVSPARKRCQKPCETITAGGPFRLRSSGAKTRPITGCVPSAAKKSAETTARVARTGSRPPDTDAAQAAYSAKAPRVRFCSRRSRKFGSQRAISRPSASASAIPTMRSEPGKGSGRRSTE